MCIYFLMVKVSPTTTKIKVNEAQVIAIGGMVRGAIAFGLAM